MEPTLFHEIVCILFNFFGCSLFRYSLIGVSRELSFREPNAVVNILKILQLLFAWTNNFYGDKNNFRTNMKSRRNIEKEKRYRKVLFRICPATKRP